MNMLGNTVVILILSVCAYAQDAPLSKDTIIQMTKVGLPDDVIVT